MKAHTFLAVCHKCRYIHRDHGRIDFNVWRGARRHQRRYPDHAVTIFRNDLVITHLPAQPTLPTTNNGDCPF